MINFPGTFLVGAQRFGAPYPKLQTSSEIFWVLHYLGSTKSKFLFLQAIQSSRNTSYFRKSNFCAKCWYRFFALIFFYISKKIPWRNYVRFWKWNLKRTSQSAYNSFLRKLNSKFCIQHDFIRHHPGLNKDQISMFRSFVIPRYCHPL